ncbi:MAG TPA: DUF2339 domain-containing protein [Myxococcota bacterium]|nr:DUF2339 domain-containing protein [Myxococcota bacterium]
MTLPDDRISALEERLARIEARLGISGARPQPAAAAQPPASAERPHPAPRPAPRRVPGPGIGATQVLAWAASLAFILAATYFVKLVYDAGWLTPERQIGIAFIGGLALIGAGLRLAELDRKYAAYLPAAGVSILYLALYAGQTMYDLWQPGFVYGAIAVVTFTAVWLGLHFENGVYSLLAIVGSYLAPFLVHGAGGALEDVVAYFSAWSVLFSVLAVFEGRRLTYLLALVFALVGFDMLFRMLDPVHRAWTTALLYQLSQFAVFSAAAVVFSVRHREPLTSEGAAVHGLALFYFYGVEYALLHENLPEWAPWLALASVVVVIALYLAARAALGPRVSSAPAAVLVASYASLVTAHVMFFELVPEAYTPWLALLLPAISLALWSADRTRALAAPVVIVSTILFSFELGRLFLEHEHGSAIPYASALLCLYAVVLYLTYAWFRRGRGTDSLAPLLLYAGHVTLLTASTRIFDSGFVVSIVWAVFALALLLYAVQREERTVGQSSLVVFAASGLKVLFYDLSGRATLLRVLTLVILAVSLYAGGWLYQRMAPPDERFHPDREVNAQLNLIRRLLGQGLTNEGIADELAQRGIPYLGSAGSWSAEVVQRLRADYPLG